MEATAEGHIRDIYSEKELEQMDSIEEAVSWQQSQESSCRTMISIKPVGEDPPTRLYWFNRNRVESCYSPYYSL